MITADNITDGQIRELAEASSDALADCYAALGRIERAQSPTNYAAGINEPFCACGRRWSECDGSRKACGKHRARARCAEILNARAASKAGGK